MPDAPLTEWTRGYRAHGHPTRQLLKSGKGSSGTFTIAATIPIALFVGLYMYRLRKGRIIEASLIGAAAVLAATVAGAWIPGSPLEGVFSLTKGQTVLALTAYGFVASVLPVWMLLCPRDYLSSFLKIGTVILLIVAVFVANPVLPSPMLNPVFQNGGPTFPGGLFPFVFICIMCGSISGFHALVSSGTTPKMIDKERQIRPIGYGAMLMEGVVGIVALLAAASLPPKLYYDINVGLDKTATYQKQLDRLYTELGNARHGAPARWRRQPLRPAAGRAHGRKRVASRPHRRRRDAGRRHVVHHERRPRLDQRPAGRGRADEILVPLRHHVRGAVHPHHHRHRHAYRPVFVAGNARQGGPPIRANGLAPGAILATAAVTAGWGILVYTGSIDTIWPMFGIANQLLAVVALCVVTTLLVNTGRGRYAWVTLLPMLFVLSTTMTAAYQMCRYSFPTMIQSGQVPKGSLSMAMTVFVVTCVLTLLLLAAARWFMVARADPGAAGP